MKNFKIFFLISIIILQADTSLAKISNRLRRAWRFNSFAMAAPPPPAFSWAPAAQTGDMYEPGNNPQLFTLTNAGTGNATVLAFNLNFEFVDPSIGPSKFGGSVHPDRFVITNTTCGSSLPSGNSCNIEVTFRGCTGGCTMVISNRSTDFIVSSDAVTSPAIQLTYSPLGTAN